MQPSNSTHGRAPHRRRHANHPHALSAIEWAIIGSACLGLASVLACTVSDPCSPNVATAPIRVRPSQTLWEIAAQHRAPGLSTAQTVEFILTANGLSSARLQSGQIINVPDVQDGAVQVVLR